MIKKLQIILVLALCFVLVLGITAAQYRSEVSVSDKAYVAAFVVDAVSNPVDSLTIDCADTNHNAVYNFTVRNTRDDIISDVSLSYVVELVLSEKLPDGITVTVDDLAGQVSEDGLTYRFSDDDWRFGIDGADGRDHSLVFAADSSQITSDVLISNISINIIAEQID